MLNGTDLEGCAALDCLCVFVLPAELRLAGAGFVLRAADFFAIGFLATFFTIFLAPFFATLEIFLASFFAAAIAQYLVENSV
ncbi:MAG: hypothetical protein M3Q28_01555 [Pseudomonadota bacterium]|nr:hypothetical protein [Pseudomonadota bacterium]